MKARGGHRSMTRRIASILAICLVLLIVQSAAAGYFISRSAQMAVIAGPERGAHAYAHTDTYTHAYADTHAYTYAYAYADTHTDTHTHADSHAYADADTHAHAYAYADSHAYAHAHTVGQRPGIRHERQLEERDLE